jgi:hypothetical protein
MPIDQAAYKARIDGLTKRALSHGVDLSGGIEMSVAVERLVDRMDLYRADKGRPEVAPKGRVLIE